MKNLNKILSPVLAITILTMHINISFANSALDQAQRATSNAPRAFDGSVNVPPAPTPSVVKPNSDNSASNPSASTQPNTASQPPKEDPEKPGFLTKLGWDVVNNKESYIALGVASGFLGFILGGPIGALIGIGAMFAFTVSQRAWYIKDYAKKPS